MKKAGYLHLLFFFCAWCHCTKRMVQWQSALVLILNRRSLRVLLQQEFHNLRCGKVFYVYLLVLVLVFVFRVRVPGSCSLWSLLWSLL